MAIIKNNEIHIIQAESKKKEINPWVFKPEKDEVREKCSLSKKE